MKRKNTRLILFSLVLFICIFADVKHVFFQSESTISKENDVASKKNISLSNSISSDMEIPENFYSDITNITYQAGYNESGNLDSLKYKNDENRMKLIPDKIGSFFYYNISFDFGCNLSFQDFPPDYWDMYVWIDITNLSTTLEAIKFERLTINDDHQLVWVDCGSDLYITSDELHIVKYFERTFGFRLLSQLDMTENKTIEIDRFRLMLTHKGTLDTLYEGPYLGLYSNNTLDRIGYNPIVLDENEWWDKMDDGKSIYYEFSALNFPPGSPACIAWGSLVTEVSLYCDFLFNITKVRKIIAGVNCTTNGDSLDDSFTYRGLFDYTNNYWVALSLKDRGNYTYYFIDDWSETYSNLENFYKIYQNNKSVTFMVSFEAYYQQSSKPDLQYYVYLDYFNISIFGKGLNWNSKSDYPRIFPININNVSVFDNFTILAKAKANYLENTLESVKYLILNQSGEIIRDYGFMDYNTTYDFYETPITGPNCLNALDFNEGEYTLLLCANDSNGYTTFNISKLIIYNENPTFSIDSPIPLDEIDMEVEDLDIVVNISDLDNSDSDYEDSVYFKLFIKDGSNVTNWIKMNYDSSIFRWESQLTRTDLKNCQDGNYTIEVRVHDPREYFYKSIDVEIIGLPNDSSINGSNGDDGDREKKDINNQNILLILLSVVIGFSTIGLIILIYSLKKRTNS